ncbi:MAG: alcohol dehydrogenase catalytic domain-containing protein, partial [Blastocatellia bacterium]
QLAAVMKRPIILGHEVVGTVVEKGDAVSELQVGDRVGVPWLHWSCGKCEICLDGNENLCPSQLVTGGTVNGGHAEFVKAKASHAMKVPESLPSDQAAPIFCAGLTVYRAAKKANIKPGQRVAVFGVGGLGHLAVQIAKSFGAEVTAIDVSEDKLEFARTLGADRTVPAVDAVKLLRSTGRVHTAIVTSGAKAAYDSAFPTIRQGGTLVVVGLPPEPLAFPALLMAATEVHIMASSVGTRKDLKEVLDIAAAGRLKCRVETRPLEKINEAFDDMRHGRLTGRVVVTP